MNIGDTGKCSLKDLCSHKAQNNTIIQLQINLSSIPEPCPRCCYPFCSADCISNADNGHSDEECAALSRLKPEFDGDWDKVDGDNYHLVLPLRMALMAGERPERFALTARLMDHRERRKRDRQECVK